MTDKLSQQERSRNMSRIRNRDTKPELLVRSLVHKLGYRFRLQQKIEGCRPDLVLKRLGTVIFVHGCFWHRHAGCVKATVPKTRTEFWIKKFEDNVARDRRLVRRLRKAGWRVITVWECELKAPAKLVRRLSRLLGDAENG